MSSKYCSSTEILRLLSGTKPRAIAQLESEGCTAHGTAMFFESHCGTFAVISVTDLVRHRASCPPRMLSVKISLDCESRSSAGFCAGDFPPLLVCGDRAFCAVMTDRMSISSMIGRTLTVGDGLLKGTVTENKAFR